MGKNKELGLPFDKMQKVLIVFDVDGTLIDGEDNPHIPTQDLLFSFIYQKWKNVDIAVWSGGGADYARTIVSRQFDGELIAANIKFYSKLQHEELRKKYSKIIAIDDIQDTAIGDVNLIVRNK